MKFQDWALQEILHLSRSQDYLLGAKTPNLPTRHGNLSNLRPKELLKIYNMHRSIGNSYNNKISKITSFFIYIRIVGI